MLPYPAGLDQEFRVSCHVSVVDSREGWNLPSLCGFNVIHKGSLHCEALPKQLELELIQPHMAQKPVLRGEMGCACVAREVKTTPDVKHFN